MIKQSLFLKKKEKHHFHLVDNSSLPLLTALSIFLLVLSFVFWFHPVDSLYWNYFDNMLFQLAWIFFLLVLLSWFLTVLVESDIGYHTLAVRIGLRYGMALFIVSEVLFFFAFFWAFFHVSLAPSVAIGCVWPPKSLQALDIWELPLTNTLLLLSSGLATTLAHKALWSTDHKINETRFNLYLLIAILLGIVFLCCQLLEYKYGLTFSWKENIYGSTFFVTTGFHGFHVTIGTIFLIFCFTRIPLKASFLGLGQKIVKWYISSGSGRNLKQAISQRNKLWDWSENKLSLTKEQHLGFEAAAWYWHFVDVVWIFLFLTVYWWGSY